MNAKDLVSMLCDGIVDDHGYFCPPDEKLKVVAVYPPGKYDTPFSIDKVEIINNTAVITIGDNV